MYLNIITACTRIENLLIISDSIKNTIPKENYRWIVVFDSDRLPDKELIPDNCEYYLHHNDLSIVGNSQKNFALGIINTGYIYMNDDDTIIHPNLWENIKNLDNNDFISFMQENKNGKMRLRGNTIREGKIDSHNFIISFNILGDTRWEIDKYSADGKFAEKIYKKSKKHIYIPIILSTYNSLSID